MVRTAIECSGHRSKKPYTKPLKGVMSYESTISVRRIIGEVLIMGRVKWLCLSSYGGYYLYLYSTRAICLRNLNSCHPRPDDHNPCHKDLKLRSVEPLFGSQIGRCVSSLLRLSSAQVAVIDQEMGFTALISKRPI